MTERYGRLVARARMLAVSQPEAEDLVQDALIATFGKPRSFPSIAAAEQYVRSAIVTSYLNSASRSAKEQSRVLRAAGPDRAEDHSSGVDSSLDVVAALGTLPPRVRACIALRYLDDMSIAETARQLNLTEGAVKRYVSDGLKVLNTYFGTTATANDGYHVAISSHQGEGR